MFFAATERPLSSASSSGSEGSAYASESEFESGTGDAWRLGRLGGPSAREASALKLAGHQGVAPDAAPGTTPSADAARPLSARFHAAFDKSQGATNVRCAHGAPHVTVGSFDGGVRTYDTNSGTRIFSQPALTNGTGAACLDVRYRPPRDNAAGHVLYASYSDGSLHSYHVTSERRLTSASIGSAAAYSLDLSKAGDQIALGCEDAVVRVLDERTLGEVCSLKGGHANRINAVRFSPDDPKALASAGWDNTLRVWDVRSGKLTFTAMGAYVCGDAVDVRGQYVLAASWRTSRQLEVFDLRGGDGAAAVHCLEFVPSNAAELGRVYTASFAHALSDKTGRLHIAAGGGRRFRLFDLAAGAVVADFDAGDTVHGHSFSPDGAFVALGLSTGVCALGV